MTRAACPQRVCPRWITFLTWPLFVLGIGACILLSIPPWIDYFATGLGDHWDTRLMGQWMAWNAHSIFDGNVLLPDFTANFFYPHANTLAFSEALWPQSFVYAAILFTTDNPFLSFNGTLLCFWIVSGLTMYALLKHLGMSTGIGVLGCLIFVLIPYRLGYYIEFNMTLTFCVPLIWLAYLRWIKAPNALNTAAVGIVYWICLSSCIYYTLIALVVVLILFVTNIRDDAKKIRSPVFLAWLGLTIAIIAVESYIFLAPYIELNTVGDYVRNDSDYSRHYLQAVHYINPLSSIVDYRLLGFDLPIIPDRISEIIAFPGIALTLLACVYFFESLRSRFAATGSAGVMARNLEWARFFCFSVFWISLVIPWLANNPPQPVFPGWLTLWSATAVVLLTIGMAFFPASNDENHRVISRLGASAVICFFLSLGQNLTLGIDENVFTVSANPLGWIFNAIPLFDALRALSRFSIVVLSFLVVAGCFVMSTLSSRQPVTLLFIPLAIGLMIFEGRQNFYAFSDQSEQISSPVVEFIEELPLETPIAQLPLGPREFDADVVLLTARDPRPLVNGHSGFAPSYYYDWTETLRDWNIKSVAHDFMSIWPEPWVIVNFRAANFLSTGWRKNFPYETVERYWQPVASDDYYNLYKPRQRTHKEQVIIKWLRRDVLAANPLLRFEARVTDESLMPDEAANFRIRVNDSVVAKHAVGTQWKTQEILLDLSAAGSLSGDKIRLELDGASSWEVRQIDFAPTPDNQQKSK